MISRKEQYGNYTFVTVSDMGTNHRINHLVNQDAVDFFVRDGDFAIALSDGVGSCIKAELGAKSAVLAVKKAFLAVKEKVLIPDIFQVTQRIIKEWINLLEGENINDCCATLKAVIKVDDALLLVSIGDGMLAVSSSGMKSCAPLENDFFTNQTKCLNDTVKCEDFWTSIFKLDVQLPYVIFLCSDGVSNGIQTGKEMELVSEIETVIEVEELQHELEILLVDLSEYSSDDRTVGVVKYERKNTKLDGYNGHYS